MRLGEVKLDKSLAELRLIAVDIINLTREKKLTLEETFYVLECVKFYGMYNKIKENLEVGFKSER